jgi:hypothetical protein
VELTVRKRYAGKWQGLASYTYNNAKGNSNSDSNADFQGDVLWLDPNAPVPVRQAAGLDRPSVQDGRLVRSPEGLPARRRLSLELGHDRRARRSRRPAATCPYRVATAYEFNGVTQRWLAPDAVGSLTNPSWGQFDLRVQYVTRIQKAKIEAFVDIFNLFNNQDATRLQDLLAGSGRHRISGSHPFPGSAALLPRIPGRLLSLAHSRTPKGDGLCPSPFSFGPQSGFFEGLTFSRRRGASNVSMKIRPYVLAGLAVCAIASSLAAQQIVVNQEVRTLPGGTAIDTIAGLPGMGPSNAPMPMGSAVVFGQVTEAESTRPVAGAIVTLSIPGAQPLRVMADGQGRFGFRDLPKGRFSLTTTRPGWSDGAYGRTRPGGTALGITLAEGERVSGGVVPMWRFASITGTVVDEQGEPIVNASVRVLKRQLANGRVRLTPQSQDTTDDSRHLPDRHARAW